MAFLTEEASSKKLLIQARKQLCASTYTEKRIMTGGDALEDTHDIS
jgi:hypothetical protein